MLNFKSDPAFEKLKNILDQEVPYKNLWDVLYVSGIPSEYTSLLNKEFENYSFITVTTLPQDLKNYVDSLVFIDLKETKYSEIIAQIDSLGLRHEDRISQKGEYSVKGDVVIFWPSIYPNPIKIDYFGDEPESIEMYDISINRKIQSIDTIVIGDETRFESGSFSLELQNIGKEFKNQVLVFDQFQLNAQITFDFRQPRLFFQRFDLLESYIESIEKENYQIIINTNHEDPIPKNLKKYINNNFNYPSGIISATEKILILTDREIFGTIFLKNEVNKNISSSQSRKMLAQFEGEVEIGDYVVHEDHGIGIYKGIIQEEINSQGAFNNYIQIAYLKDDEILVPLSMVYKITKYIGNDGEKPELTSLSKAQWKILTAKAKASVQIMASELVRHYAKISLSKAEVLNQGDSEMYMKFVEGFEHLETDDQLRSIHEVEKDLMDEKPMNRLLIGDVGFGKTEVIMRAAFKACESGKQVAILAPTTILVDQHTKNFKKRFAGFPFEIASLSRFNNKYENQDIIESTKKGKIDIVIGTHRLLSNDVEFKNLGLLVVDEEQKFGVKQKEKLKRLEYGVHVLTTTATPIPRSLSMALSSIQEISTIQTPPRGRKPVKVEVSKMDWNKIVDAIRAEKSRGGQIFIIHNSIQTIDSIGARLKILLPDLKVAIAHGRMTGDALEKIMLDFLNQKTDCLLCTTILENGIDIKNVNTLIVLKAQNFGLSQLYQLKGRVGRSEAQAYSYFFYDGLNIENNEEIEFDEDTKSKKRDKDYIKRLKALSEAKELGAGFEIATKDLEIRGAGNLLGKEQHGNISKIGFGLYMQMLADEIERLKNDHQN